MADSATLGNISPFFIVENLRTSVAFYRDAMGFEVRLLSPSEQEAFFAIVGRDQTQILLKEIAPNIKPQPNPTRHAFARWDAFVFVQDPDTFAAELQSRRVAFSEELKDWEDGLRGFAVADNNGYVIFFGKPI